MQAGDPSPSRCSSYRLILIWVLFIGGAIIVISGAIAFFVDVFYPKLPRFQVESLSLTNFISSESVASKWQVRILVKNHNKNLAVNYGTLKSTVYYQNTLPSESLLMPFRQGSMLETTLNVTLFAVDVKVEPIFLDGINRERERGSVGFSLKVAGSTKYGPGPRKVFSLFILRRTLHVLCSRVVIDISSNSSLGNLVGGAIDCQVMERRGFR